MNTPFGQSRRGVSSDASPRRRLPHHAPRTTHHAPLPPSFSSFNLFNPAERGIALVIVMISVTVLTILAAGFAYSMKVETKLARNAYSEAELEWLGRSGVEYARWVLALSSQNPYESHEQTWHRGHGPLPDPPPNLPVNATFMPMVPEVQNPLTLGHGTATWSITDLESRFNINSPEPILQQILPQALTLMGVAPGEATPIVNSILDWIDRDDQTHMEGAENRDYDSLNPPYLCKDGPIDDISELLLIKGITPEIFYGPSAANYQPTYYSRQRGRFGQPAAGPPPIAVGFTNLFTPLSSGRININTAPAEVFQLIPGVDQMIAEAIVSGRSGEDDGSGLMGPYRSVDQIRRAPNIPLEIIRQIQPFCDVRSKTFQVQVDAEIAGYKRTFYAILGRNNQRDVQILSFYWK